MDIKLGSLFDGAGGFPLAGSIAGLTPIWASEIEPFPIRVTTKRFPKMKHLGDIEKIDGRRANPVDVITFGSPCQDLSVAGNREGLSGKRSKLFLEAIRIIREMREITNGEKPKYIVWENVPGAFSSNKGEDFRTVLEEIVKIKDGGASIPRPEKGKWMPAGEVLADDYSVAWRVYDAQYWGVPQRRKRIYLVADFTGGRAGDIQFKRESLLGNFAQGGGTRKGDSGTSERNVGASGKIIEGASTIQGNMTDRHAVVYGLSSKDSNGWKSANPHSGCYVADATRTLDTRGGNPACNQGGNIVVQETRVYENHSQDGRYRELDGICETIVARYGTGGNNVPIVVKGNPYCIGNGQVHSLGLDEKSRTLSCMHDQIAIIHGYPYRARRLTPLECCRLQGYPDWWADGLDNPEPTQDEVETWMRVFETHRKAISPNAKPKTENQVRKWLKHPQSDSAEYRMWGNSLAIPCAYTVLKGIAEELSKEG